MDLFDRYPSLRSVVGPQQTSNDWDALFANAPDGMLRIFADIIKSEYAVKGRVGQRPMPREEEVNVRQFLADDYTDLPISDALPKLMKVSKRAFAMKVGMSWTNFRRVLSGEVVPDPSQLRRIAKAANVSPLYFLEYRRMMLLTAMANLFEGNSELMNALVTRYVRTRTGVDIPESAYEQRMG
jgi:hypothetical protein